MPSDEDDLLPNYQFDYGSAKPNRFAVDENSVAAIDVQVDADTLTVTLEEGRQLRIPLTWYPRLAAGSAAERENWELLGDGYAIAWADLDEHIGVEGLLAGRKSQESKASFERWLGARRVGQ